MLSERDTNIEHGLCAKRDTHLYNSLVYKLSDQMVRADKRNDIHNNFDISKVRRQRVIGNRCSKQEYRPRTRI